MELIQELITTIEVW